MVTTAQRSAAYSMASRWYSAEKSATASATRNGWMSLVNASTAVISTPTWAYTPQTTSWSRPCSRIRSSRPERKNAL